MFSKLLYNADAQYILKGRGSGSDGQRENFMFKIFLVLP